MSGRRYQRVGVLMGGPSSEREVSLNSGQAVAEGLQAAGYSVQTLEFSGEVIPDTSGVEAEFVALHGRFGEDGGVQTILRDRGVPYTGAGPASSRLAFDKIESKRLFDREGICNPAWEILRSGQARRLPLPVVVKPAREGSSIGVHRVFEERDWRGALADALTRDDEVIVEEFIEGRELTVGLVVREDPREGEETLPVIEIVPEGGFYNYRAKYGGGSTYHVPADIPEATALRCREVGARVFRALGAEGLGRVDFRLRSGGELFVLELNTIPGFTKNSLLPKAARAAGFEFSALCDRIMRSATVH